HTVDDRLVEIVGVLRRDHHVTQLAGHAVELAGTVDRKGEDVGRTPLPAMLRIERSDPSTVDERDRDMPLLHPRARSGERAQALDLRLLQDVLAQRCLGEYLYLDDPRPHRPSATLTASARLGPAAVRQALTELRSVRRLALGVHVVGLDD